MPPAPEFRRERIHPRSFVVGAPALEDDRVRLYGRSYDKLNICSKKQVCGFPFLGKLQTCFCNRA